MLKLSGYAFTGAILSLAIATLFYWWYSIAASRLRVASLGPAGDAHLHLPGGPLATTLGKYGTIFAVNGLGFLTASLLARALVTGHGPFSNMYEFSGAFTWGVLAVYLYCEVKYRVRILGSIAIPVGLAMLLYATTIPSDTSPLVPALQNNLLLSLHVAVAVIAYGAFAVGFGAGLLFLVQEGWRRAWLPNLDLLDEIGYRAVTIGFPMQALVIILGAIWADVAWGSYWSWDPKETASLVTWLIYGGYLHARTMRGWKGTRSAALLILGFAATLFTYFGNLFFTGLHAYSGVS